MAAKDVPGAKGYENGFKFTMHEDRLDIPLRWKKPKMIFVNSMSDLFHPKMEPHFLAAILNTMVETPQHTYQILTKRPELVNWFMQQAGWLDGTLPDNIWIGTSVENAETKWRIDALAGIFRLGWRFLSMEPLIGDPGKLSLDEMDWVIVGGESGAKARPMHPKWARSVRDQCEEQGVPFFFKQWGAHGEDGVRRSKKANGRLLDGKEYNEYPRHIIESNLYI